MSARASLGLITVGAILTFAVRAEPSFLDLHVTGLILIAVGLIRPLAAGWSSLAPRITRREVVVEEVEEPGAEPMAASRAVAHRTGAVRPPAPRSHASRTTTSA